MKAFTHTATASSTTTARVHRQTRQGPARATDVERAGRMEHIDAILRELEEAQPSPLLMRMATGFPSALLCVLALGALVGALAGQQATRPVAKSAPETKAAQSALATLAPSRSPVAVVLPAGAAPSRDDKPVLVLTAKAEPPPDEALLTTVAQRHQRVEDALFAPQVVAGGSMLDTR